MAIAPPGIAEVLQRAGLPINETRGNSGLASSEEIYQAYGGDLAYAAQAINKYACVLEDAVKELSHYAQVREAQAMELAQKVQADNFILTDLNTLGQWYLDLAASNGEAKENWREILAAGGSADDFSLLPPSNQRQAPQMGMNGMTGMNPQMAQMQQQMNPGLNPAALAAQYMQSAAQGTQMPQVQRPEFPQVPTPSNGQGMSPAMLNQVPPSERWRYIDALSQNGGFRGARLRVA